jgi:hypothetical protein
LFLVNRRSVLTEGIDDIFWRWVIARFAAAMLVEQHSSRPDHEDATELPGVALDPLLSVSLPESADRIERQPWGQDLDPPASQPSGPIRAQLGIDEQGTVDAHFIAEPLGEETCTVADDHELGSKTPDLRKLVAQLRDLLAAEDSTEVSDEDQHHRPLFPERLEADLMAVDIFEYDGS